MCLPIGCCDGEDHGPRSHDHNGGRRSPAADHHHGDGNPYEPPVVAWSPDKGANHGYGIGNNGAGDAGPYGRAGAMNLNGQAGAGFYNDSDSDMPASVGRVRGRKGAAEKIVTTPALALQTPHHMATKTTSTWGSAPAPQAHHVAAGARHHGPVAASQPREGASTGTTQTAPMPQVARRDEDVYSATAASTYGRWR